MHLLFYALKMHSRLQYRSLLFDSLLLHCAFCSNVLLLFSFSFSIATISPLLCGRPTAPAAPLRRVSSSVLSSPVLYAFCSSNTSSSSTYDCIALHCNYRYTILYYSTKRTDSIRSAPLRSSSIHSETK